MQTMTKKRTAIRNGSRRGAATAEAVLAVMLMTIFLWLTIWVHTGYTAKVREEAKTRNEALTEASHACSGGGGDSMPTGASLGGQAGGIAGRVGGGGMGDAMSMKSVTKTGSASFSQTVTSGRGRRDRNGRVEAWSSVLCRPEPQSSGNPFGGGLGSLRGSVGL
jgi:hypothetical protein